MQGARETERTTNRIGVRIGGSGLGGPDWGVWIGVRRGFRIGVRRRCAVHARMGGKSAILLATREAGAEAASAATSRAALAALPAAATAFSHCHAGRASASCAPPQTPACRVHPDPRQSLSYILPRYCKYIYRDSPRRPNPQPPYIIGKFRSFSMNCPYTIGKSWRDRIEREGMGRLGE
eukprot:363445-Prorocentrum_minimum.AAC.6